MRSVRTYIVGLVAAGGVAVAAASLLAQAPEPPPTPRPHVDRRFMMLDGRGSHLGVMVADLDASAAKDAPSGARIEEVDPGSPAEKAGVRAGDIVVEYDGERVRSARQFTRLVQETAEGRKVPMAVVRDGQRQTLQVAPEERAAAWSFGIDGERLRRDIERGLRDLPDMRDFRFEGPAFNFRGMPGASPRVRLGLQVDDLSPQLADYFGAGSGGVLVTGVAENSPAGRAGLKAGDVITSVNGAAVRDDEALAREVRDADGPEITIGVLRDRKEMTVKATVDTDGQPRRPARGRRPA